MKNKKSLLICFLALFTIAGLFAADNYVVESVTGKVTYQKSADKWVDVTAGQELSLSTIINTGMNAKLVLKDGDKTITIKAMQKDTVEKLVAAAGTGKGGLKKNPIVSKGEVSSDLTESKKGVATASSRASEAKGDLDWDEDE